MQSRVDIGEQLVVVLYVRDIKDSSQFYRNLGFEIAREEGTFMELRWQEAQLFLEERQDAPPPRSHPVGNIRILVANVDDYWAISKKIGAQVIRPVVLQSVLPAGFQIWRSEYTRLSSFLNRQKNNPRAIACLCSGFNGLSLMWESPTSNHWTCVLAIPMNSDPCIARSSTSPLQMSPCEENTGCRYPKSLTGAISCDHQRKYLYFPWE